MEEIDKQVENAAKSCPFIQPHNCDSLDEQVIGLKSAIWGIKSEAARDYWIKTFPESEQIKALEQKLFRLSKMGLQLIAENKKLKEQLNGKS